MLDWRPSVILSQLEKIAGTMPEFHLVDVGASGGLHSSWSQWGDRLHALGIDALVKEVVRLTDAETRPHVKYADALVTGPPRISSGKSRSNYALHRSAAYLGTILKTMGPELAASMTTDEFLALWEKVARGEYAMPPSEANYSNVADRNQDPFYAHYARMFEKAIGLEDVTVSRRTVLLDELVAASELQEVDLLKVDTDGYDLDVLRGADSTLEGALFVEIECQFHGLIGPEENVFANIDTHLRNRGFSLLKLAPFSYGRSALPPTFVYPHLPAQTRTGPLQWADALYGRDVLGGDNDAGRLTDRRLQIMACIFEMYGLEDMAAELILRLTQAFGGEVRPILDALSAKLMGEGTTYDDVWKQFGSSVAGYA